MPIAFAVTYGVGSAAFAGMLLLVLLGRRPAGPGWRIVLVCAVTLFWTLAAAVGSTRFAGATAVLESARSAAWLWFMSSWLAASPQGEGKASRNYLPILALAVGAAAVGNDLRFVAAAVDPVHPDFTQILVRVAVAVTGLLVVENLYRNTSEARRWHVVPICIGIGGMFAYDLFLYSDALLFRRVDLSLLAARGAMMALIVPMLALTLARNRDWRIDIHISRQAVFHTATLLASGRS